MAKTTMIDSLISINFTNDWIVDSSCGYHLTDNASKFSSFQDYKGNDVIIAMKNSIHLIENEGIVTINGDGDNHITLNSVIQVPSMKNIFLIANVVDSGHYILLRPKVMKFILNITSLKEDVIHTNNKVKDLFVLSSYFNKNECKWWSINVAW